MKRILYLIFFSLSGFAYGQQESTIHILLANSNELNVEKRRFFNQPDYEKIGGLSNSKLAFQLNRGNKLPNSPDFKVQKIDDNNYILKIKTENPEMVYLNYKPIYIEPGDNVKVTYTVLLKTFDQLIDTITATGDKKGNYEFAKYDTHLDSKVKYPNINSGVYKDKISSFYKDLRNYYRISNSVYDTDPRFKTCSKNLIDYLKRKNSETFLFNLIFFEDKLPKESNPVAAKLLGDSLEFNFNKTKFIASDTLLNFTMENLIKKYFERMSGDKFANLATENNYRQFFNYINNLPDRFVRDYFLMLLIGNYRKEVDRYSPQLISNLDKEIVSRPVLENTKKIVG